MSHRCNIRVGAGAGETSWASYAAIFNDLLPVQISFAEEIRDGQAGEVLFERPGAPEEQARPRCGSVLHLPRLAGCAGDLRQAKIRFADDGQAPFPFRGREIVANVPRVAGFSLLNENERALAWCEDRPVWTVSLREGEKHYRSAFPLPNLAPASALFDVFNGERFLELLPFVHWIRELSGLQGANGPGLRACFIFDDPNLHWLRYGCIDFKEVASRAHLNNYHVSFATIPLDAWFTHRKTAEVFRNNARQLSLCVHGNNHTKRELAAQSSQEDRQRLLSQSIQRIERLERTAGLQVCRVMIPPHGACAEEMLAELPIHGFESASISHGSLRTHNRSQAWTKRLGVLPTEIIRGCPVLPRWAFAGCTTNVILLAAYLRQPLLLRGHHQDVKDGLDVLDYFAGIINSLGPVYWSKMSDLNRINFDSELLDDVYRVRPYSRKLLVEIPAQANRLLIENPGCGSSNLWRLSAGNGNSLEIQNGTAVPLAKSHTRKFVMETAQSAPSSSPGLRQSTSGRALLRRLLTEGRDRMGFA